MALDFDLDERAARELVDAMDGDRDGRLTLADFLGFFAPLVDGSPRQWRDARSSHGGDGGGGHAAVQSPRRPPRATGEAGQLAGGGAGAGGESTDTAMPPPRTLACYSAPPRRTLVIDGIRGAVVCQAFPSSAVHFG
eukprot:SAG25_NODE_733_length_5663_cov_27.142523_3_plen_137_part_00